MTCYPSCMRLPWLCREQPGESLIPLMNRDPRACVGKKLRFVIDETLAAAYPTALRLWKRFQRSPQAQQAPEAQAAFGRLSSFVVAGFVGTAVLGFAGVALRAMDPGSGRTS